MFTAQSPYDQPTGRIDVRKLQAWWAYQRREARATTRARWVERPAR